jgi:hypothetical protein
VCIRAPVATDEIFRAHRVVRESGG